MNRRDFCIAAGLAALPLHSSPAQANMKPTTQKTPGASSNHQGAFHIGMLVFPDMTNLDFAGPFEVLTMAPGTVVHVLAKSREPVRTDSGCVLLPSGTLDEAPQLDMVFVGGGLGVNVQMGDEATLRFLSTQAQSAHWVTSVCTGALILGAAGLLRGYKATTHWTAMDILPVLGAEPVHQRVVVDRNRITGGGVTAGIDFGLEIVKLLWGEDTAQKIALILEYDPHPPVSGSPQYAPANSVAAVRQSAAKLTQVRMVAARNAMKVLGDLS